MHLPGKTQIQASINLLLDVLLYDMPFNELSKKECRSLTGISAIDLELANQVRDRFIYKFPEQVNEVLLQQLEGKLIFDRDITVEISKLVQFASHNKIPIIYSAPFRKNSEHFYGSENLNDRRNSQNRCIRYVLSVNPNLNYENIPLSDLLINFLAHEIGHALDYCKDLLMRLNDPYFLYQREVNAWNIAEKTMRDIGIENKNFGKQRSLTLARYKNYYQIT